jgi:hypothetical protein
VTEDMKKASVSKPAAGAAKVTKNTGIVPVPTMQNMQLPYVCWEYYKQKGNMNQQMVTACFFLYQEVLEKTLSLVSIRPVSI